ncbi:ABC transporter permease [Schaalia canis]|uniref:ABC transporter permease n=1 Tax=Schaalia canis TaxID=100469 RepID=UPI0014021169|nr:FtsX-like permease family protein [Schaalia canis]
MLTRILRADLARHRLVAVVLTALIALVTTLAASATLITARTLHTIDHFFTASQVPNVVQMHTGELDAGLVTQWVTQRADIVDHQLQRTLPIPGRSLWIGGVHQGDSVLEPAAVTAPERFDFLLDEDGRPVAPAPGEIVLPVHYLAAGQAEVGDEVLIQTGATQMHLRVSGFLRDAQMNPSLVTSKRMAVHPQDYAALSAHYAPEYLIEFRLAEGASGTDLIDAYVAAGLPAKGIAVTDSIFWLMNGMSTFAMAAIALLAAALLTVIAMIALRLAVLSALDNEIAPLAVLRAIGTPFVQVRRIFLIKYVVMAGAGAAVGVACAYPLSAWLGEGITLYFGRAPHHVGLLLTPLIVGAIVVGLTVVFCLQLLRGLRRCSSAELLRMGAQGRSGTHKKGRGRRLLAGIFRQQTAAGEKPEKKSATEKGEDSAIDHVRASYLRASRLLSSPLSPLAWMTLRAVRKGSSVMLALVVMGATLTAFLPAALTQTMSDPRFATYLGIGAADLRIDLRPETGGDAPPQADDAASGAADVGLMQRALAAHEEIEAFALYRSYSVEVSTPGRDAESLVVEVGDHHAFPVSYIEGKAPALPEEVPADSSVDEAGTRQGKALEGAAEERAARKTIPAEIALSYSAAQQLEVTVGDVIVVESDETREAEARIFTVSGIYQDLTNGGRSGKTSEPLSSTPLWQVAYATLTQPGNAAHTQAIADELATQIPGAKVTDISEYIAQTMGTVHAQLRVVSWVAGLSALGVIALITHLVTLLVCAREKRDREVLLRIGASPAALRRTYLARMIVIACGGTLGALALTFTVGEMLIGMAFGMLGAPSIHLLPNPWLSFIVIPAAVILAVWLATHAALQHVAPLARTFSAPHALSPAQGAPASRRTSSGRATEPSGDLAKYDEPGGHHD